MRSAKKAPPLGRAGSEPVGTIEAIEAELEVVAGPALTAEEVARFEAAVAQADAEHGPGVREETRVNFRWERAPLGIVQRAAALAGVPYQTYIKQVLYQRAIADLTAASAVDPRARRPAAGQ